MSLRAEIYGWLGRVGIGVPQANPTVEAELGILLPRGFSTVVTRLRSDAATPTGRLIAYMEQLEAALGGYDELRPDVFGFACTGSSYLLGREREERLIADASQRFGYPVLTATAAIRWALERIGARRIAVAAPYPAELIEAAVNYWAEDGVELVALERVRTRTTDTRSIYELDFTAADRTIAALDASGADAILLSGTGMPSLPAILAGGRLPILSSNLALAGLAVHTLQPEALAPGDIAPPGWTERLREAMS